MMKRPLFTRFATFLLLLWLFGILIAGARQLSITVDEPFHIAVGYAILARGQEAFWILPSYGHPPLLSTLEAALLFLEKPHIPVEQLNGWQVQTTDYLEAFYPYLRPLERTELIARVPVIWLTVLLAAITYRWGKELGNSYTGLVGMGMLCFDPTLLAHGRLATTDAGTIMWGTASLYVLWRWMKRPSLSKAALVGGLLGLTSLSKVSGLIWVGTSALLVLYAGVRDHPNRGRRMYQGLLIGLIAFLVLWAGYGFNWGPVLGLPGTYPAPEHWNEMIVQKTSITGQPIFALGRRGVGHWWWYFPLAFLIKNPIPLQIGVLTACIVIIRKPLPLDDLIFLIFFPFLYALISVTQGMNIGYRHLLPLHISFYLLVGIGSLSLIRSGRTWRVAAAVLSTWYILGTVSCFPFEIAYFNEWVGGSRNGHLYLADSNLDWGQGYKALYRYWKEHPGPKMKIAPFSPFSRPEDYGISDYEPYPPLPPRKDSSPPSPFHPLPGRYAISISRLQVDEAYNWFRQIEPVAEVGYSFFVYDVSHPPLKWVSQCITPAIPLSDASITTGFGQQDLRRTEFDCTSGWIYPYGGAEPGVYGFHSALMAERKSGLSLLPSSPIPRDSFMARRLQHARLSLNMQRFTAEFPAFVLYEMYSKPMIPAQENVRCELIPPILLEGPLLFLGASVFQDRKGIEAETWWQVTEGPITRPLSIMAHLLDPAGRTLSVADGLGVSPVFWLPGDLIVQRHRLPIPPDAPPGEYTLATGAYWLDTMERWPVISEGQPTDQILIRFSCTR